MWDECPACGAGVDDPCLTDRNYEVPWIHAGRQVVFHKPGPDQLFVKGLTVGVALSIPLWIAIFFLVTWLLP